MAYIGVQKRACSACVGRHSEAVKLSSSHVFSRPSLWRDRRRVGRQVVGIFFPSHACLACQPCLPCPVLSRLSCREAVGVGVCLPPGTSHLDKVFSFAQVPAMRGRRHERPDAMPESSAAAFHAPLFMFSRRCPWRQDAYCTVVPPLKEGEEGCPSCLSPAATPVTPRVRRPQPAMPHTFLSRHFH